MLRINEVLEMNSTLYRILKVLPDDIVWICISDKKSFPSVILKSEILNLIDNERLFIADDPYSDLTLLIPEKGSVEQVKRDARYDLIKPLTDAQEYYLPKVRSAIINKIIEKQGSTKRNIYNLARRYWQRGQIPNALIPDYKNSGAKGKKRKATTKLGRPREHMPGVGAIVNSEIERLFRIAIERYLLKEKSSSFPYAYRRFQTLYETYFPETPESEIPTRWQMMHFWKREFSQIEKIQKQKNKIEYQKDVRPIISTANMHALGPG